MEMCGIMEDGLRRASELSQAAAQAMEKGDKDDALRMGVVANGLMLSVICHGLFAHSDGDHGPELWQDLFKGADGNGKMP